MSPEAFEALAGKLWDDVPQKFRGRIDNVALLIEDEPSDAVRKEENFTNDETLLGLYHGVPESARGGGYGVGMTLPDTITLYRLPLLDEAHELMHERNVPFQEAIEAAIRETLWHEIGHYFGLAERQVRARESRGTNRFGN